MQQPSRPLLLYQDTCRFCKATARLVARIDRRQCIAMLGFSDAAAEPFVRAIPHRDLAESWQLILTSGERLNGGAAAVALFEILPGFRWLGRGLRIFRLTPLIGLLYRFVSRIRPTLGRFVPDLPGPRRLP